MDQNEAFVAAGARIKQLRTDQKKSQEDIAFAAGMDQSTYSKIERHGRHAVSWKKLEAVAEAMGCTIEVNFKPRV